MALAIVLQYAGVCICEECVCLDNFECPDTWFHEETGTCSDCESIWDCRAEHHEECAMRALCRLSLTSYELARRAPEQKLL